MNSSVYEAVAKEGKVSCQQTHSDIALIQVHKEQEHGYECEM